MSDDLVKRLRSVLGYKDLGICPEAADRIEELEGMLPEDNRIEELEAKLAKAVGALKKLDRLTARDAALVQAILAELKGQE